MQGLDLGDHCSLGAILVAEKARTREEAERSRLFYVGMTRAREYLVLSGAIPRRRARGALIELLQQATGTELGRSDQSDIPVGHAASAKLFFRVKIGRQPGLARSPCMLEAGVTERSLPCAGHSVITMERHTAMPF